MRDLRDFLGFLALHLIFIDLFKNLTVKKDTFKKWVTARTNIVNKLTL